jgi:hypothetical protein
MVRDKPALVLPAETVEILAPGASNEIPNRHMRRLFASFGPVLDLRFR